MFALKPHILTIIQLLIWIELDVLTECCINEILEVVKIDFMTK